MKGRKTATLTRKVSAWRSDKRHLQRPQVTIHYDHGQVKEVTTLRFPQETEMQSHMIPKKPNPHLKAIIRWPVEMIWYTDTGKGFVYDTDHNYLGSLERSDLKRLFSRSGALLRLEKK